MKCLNDGATIERSLTQSAPAAAAAPAPPAPPPGSYERERDERRQHYDQRYADPSSSQYATQPYRKKRKESWLSEIFD